MATESKDRNSRRKIGKWRGSLSHEGAVIRPGTADVQFSWAP